MTHSRISGRTIHGLVAAAVLATVPGVSQAFTLGPLDLLNGNFNDPLSPDFMSGESLLDLGLGGPDPDPQAPLVLNQHASIVSTSTARCPSFCTDVDFGQTVRNVGNTASSLTSMDDRDGSRNAGARGRAFSQLTGDLQAPILKAESFGRDGRTGRSTAYGFQGYTYEGIDTTLIFNFELTGTLAGGNDAGDAKSFISSQVALFDAQGFTAETDIGTLVYESGGRLLDDTLENEARKFLRADTPGVVDMSDSITFNVSTGDQFYIWSQLSTRALAGDDADAFNTLVTSITALDGSTPDGLLSASFLAGQVELPDEGDNNGNGGNGGNGGTVIPAEVPTPATFALLLPGLLLVAARRARS